MPAEDGLHIRQKERAPASRLLGEFARHWQGDRVRLRDVIGVLDDRAYGLLMLVLAVPNIVPNPIPGLSGMLGVPLILVAGQLMLGLRRPWLPGIVADRSVSSLGFRAIFARILPTLERIERLLHPRLRWLRRPPSEQLLAGFCVILAIILALPIPLGNTPTALAISLIALGLIEHDGLAIAAGVAVGIGSIVIVSAVLLALFHALLFFLREAL